MEKHIEQELTYQKEELERLISENDYSLTKGLIGELQRDARHDHIMVSYKEIVRQILAKETKAS